MMAGPRLASDVAQDVQPDLDLRRDGVAVYRWQLRYGDVLIEVYDDGRVAVNGQPVEFAAAR